MTDGPAPVASVVIPARDAEDSVGDTLAGLALAACALQVIVVDDGSRDATGAVAERAGAEVVRAAGEGPARARNLGCARARADVLVFTDADCRPTPGFVEALLAPLADPAIAGVKGAYLTEQRSLTARFVQQEYEERYRRMAKRAFIDFVDTYACAYRKPVFDAVGGFDERYRLPSTEDQELSFRIVATGARLVFAPQARVVHRHADTLWGYARKKAKIGRFKVATLRRHPGKAVDDAHTPLTLKLQLLLAPLALIASLALGALAALGAPPWALATAALPAALFALSCLPLTLHALRADPAVGVLTPAFCLVRGLALGWGVCAGLLAELRGGVLPEATA
ncbi:MAG: glycosyltransferase [Planctomycetes bacterium]|nr:glycosyltransferase [Planctomycetota bacterium]